MTREPLTTLDDDERQARAAIDFLDRFLVDRALGTERPLADYLAAMPGFERRIAQEWLALHGAAATTAPAPAADPTPRDDGAQRFGHYRLVRELGRGGQGIVYEAVDERLGRTVALKVLHQDLQAFAGPAELRFQREIETVAHLDHPGICTVFEAGTSDGSRWLAMRHIAGPSLQQRLDQRRRSDHGLPGRREAVLADVAIVQQLAEALQVAHSAGIVHRDVKPGNVLLGPGDAPVLLDFGLAHAVAASTPAITAPGTMVGTLCYMAPERLHDREADARGDVWALGAILFEMLTLERPFQAATPAAELHAIAHAPLRSVRERNRAVPEDLAVVIATALAREPEHRYATARDLAADLQRVRSLQPVQARPAGPLLVLQRWAQRNRALASSLGALLVVLTSGLAVSLELLGETRTALADVTRLSDLKDARELQRQAAALWPAVPARVVGSDGMDRWLVAARALVQRRSLHEGAKQRLGDATTPAAVWQKEQLQLLLADLDQLQGRIAVVEARRQAATTLAERSLVAAAKAWQTTIDAIAQSPRYGGLRLSPQLGLLPLGPDPQSGLFEFADLQSGEAPRRDAASGELQLTDACGVVLVLIPGGRAVLGAEGTAPTDGHEANTDPEAEKGDGPCFALELAPFFLSKYEMTQAQWLRHAEKNPSTYSLDSTIAQRPSLLHPVEMINWQEAAAVLAQLELQLPTEAQWEWACRAGSRTPYPYGPDVHGVQGHENLADHYAHTHDGSPAWAYADWLEDGCTVHAGIGRFLANGFGLHDMGGNVREWCADSWEDYPDVAPRAGDGLREGKHAKYRIVRGGSYATAPALARSAARTGMPQTVAAGEVGVRPARALRP